VTRSAKLAMGCVLACSLLTLVPPQARADATANDKCHAVVVAVASDQLSIDVTLLPPDPKSEDCKLAAGKPVETKKPDSAAGSGSGCKSNSDAPCDDTTHLIVTDNLVKEQLKQLHKGDRIQIVFYAETVKPTETSSPAEPKKAADTTAPPKENNSPDAKTPQDTKANKDTKPSEAGKPKDADTPVDAKNSTEAKKQYVLKAWCVDFESPGAGAILGVLLASGVACFLLTLLFSQGRPTQLIISEDNRYSNSRFQMALWFFVLITTYVAALLLRVCQLGWDFTGGVNIPSNLLLLSGMSALTFAGAKGITESKLAAKQAAGEPAPEVKPRAPKPNFLLDLTHTDYGPPVPAQPEVPAQAAVGNQPAAPGHPAVPAQDPGPRQFDFGDFQMLIVTLIAVATYVVLVTNFFGRVEYSKIVSLPDVDTTLLAAFGLGQGAYLTKKAVGNVGTS
jgi:hypothetical protein